MNKYSSFQEALSAHNIPFPKKAIRKHGFTRWGTNVRYFAKKIDDGYIFGDWKTGLSAYWFPIREKQDNKAEGASK